MESSPKTSSPYPDYFPEGCPEQGSTINDEREVYRIVKGESVSNEDFLSYKELGIKDDCRACGVSVYESLEKAIHYASLRPALGRMVAKGVIGKDSGEYRLTCPRSGHICWWPFRDVERSNCFSEVVPCFP